MVRAAITATLLIAFSFPVSGQEGNSSAPQLVLRDIKGKTLRLSDYKGKVVLINFWATWCAPCRAEMPDLVKWQREYKSRGLQVIGITHPPEELAEVRKFTESVKVNYPVVMGSEETKARFDKGDVLPLTVVIDRKGKVREVIRGIVFPEEFEQKIKPLIFKRDHASGPRQATTPAGARSRPTSPRRSAAPPAWQHILARAAAGAARGPAKSSARIPSTKLPDTLMRRLAYGNVGFSIKELVRDESPYRQPVPSAPPTSTRNSFIAFMADPITGKLKTSYPALTGSGGSHQLQKVVIIRETLSQRSKHAFLFSERCKEVTS